MLKDMFAMQAEWRREKAKEYPGDGRNLEAAVTLDHLAATADAVPDDVLDAFQKLCRDLDDAEVFNEMLRQVGFYSAPETAEAFVRAFIAERCEA